MFKKKWLILIFCFFQFTAQGEECFRSHFLSIGPEISSLKREREGGTRQRGTLYGIRASYDYLKPFRPYFGFEGAYAQGTLHGKSGGGEKLRSHFNESMLEGRIGFTLQSCSGCCGWLAPFVGGGYFWEDNDFVRPSLKKLHFRNTFGYIAVGCLSGTSICPGVDVGLFATARFSTQGKVHVSHDPEEDSRTLKYEQKVHCRVAVPLTYVCQRVDFSLVPFFEYRHYGRRNAFPFDFLDTRLKIYGADFIFTMRF